MKLTLKLTILIFCFFAKGQQDTCLPFPDDPTCGCTFSDGKTIDLRSLGNRNGAAFEIPEPVVGQYQVSYNPCFPFDTSTGCTNAAVCLEDPPIVGYTIGIQKTAKFVAINNTIIIKYSGEDHYSSQVTLKCDSGAANFSYDFSRDTSQGYTLMFTLTTSCACRDHPCGVRHYDRSKQTTYIAIGVAVTATTIVFVVIGISYTIVRHRHRCAYRKIDADINNNDINNDDINNDDINNDDINNDGINNQKPDYVFAT